MEDYNYLSELVNMFLTLIFVLGLAFVSLLVLKKFMRSKMRTLNRGTAIKILERRALHSKASLYLVDILGKGVVISESHAGGIQLITEFAPGTDVELLMEQMAQEKAPLPALNFSFAKLFRRPPKKQ